MASNVIAAVLLILGAAVVVSVYHARMNRLHPGERERVTNWPFYQYIDWYLQISTITLGLASILGYHPLLVEFHNNAWILLVGLLTAGTGLLLFIAAMWNLDRQYTPAHAAHLPTEIVTTGPYRYIRHPVYASNLLMTGGIFLASGSLWLAPNLAILIVYYQIAMQSEEMSIAARFPEYRDYLSRTGRLVPRISSLLGQNSLSLAPLANTNLPTSNER